MNPKIVLDDPLGRFISRKIEGQIRSFLTDHPEIAEAVKWKHSHKTKTQALTDSLAKRIVRDLLCDESREGLARVVEGGTVAEPSVPEPGSAVTGSGFLAKDRGT